MNVIISNLTGVALTPFMREDQDLTEISRRLLSSRRRCAAAGRVKRKKLSIDDEWAREKAYEA